MIPKIIHYCWFGGNELSQESRKCIASWKKYFPGYQIIEWNEDNFDFSSCEYARKAYQMKKWAFVSDYARYKILYDNGGIYFDTDVEVIRPFDDLLANPYMGIESIEPWVRVNPGLGMAAHPHMTIYREMLDFYEHIDFMSTESRNMKTVVEYTTEILESHGLQQSDTIQEVAGIQILPKEYLNPMNLSTGKIVITNHTHSIHYFNGSWCDKASIRRGKIYRILNRCFGQSVANHIRMIAGNNRGKKSK